jgi:hypothetical protein
MTQQAQRILLLALFACVAYPTLSYVSAIGFVLAAIAFLLCFAYGWLRPASSTPPPPARTLAIWIALGAMFVFTYGGASDWWSLPIFDVYLVLFAGAGGGTLARFLRAIRNPTKLNSLEAARRLYGVISIVPLVAGQALLSLRMIDFRLMMALVLGWNVVMNAALLLNSHLRPGLRDDPLVSRHGQVILGQPRLYWYAVVAFSVAVLAYILRSGSAA